MAHFLKTVGLFALISLSLLFSIATLKPQLLIQAAGIDPLKLELKKILWHKTGKISLYVTHLDMNLLEQSQGSSLLFHLMIPRLKEVNIDTLRYNSHPLGSLNAALGSQGSLMKADLWLNKSVPFSVSYDTKTAQGQLNTDHRYFHSCIDFSLGHQCYFAIKRLEACIENTHASLSGTLFVKNGQTDLFSLLESMTLTGSIEQQGSKSSETLHFAYNLLDVEPSQALSLYPKKVSTSTLALYLGETMIGSIEKNAQTVSFQGDLSFNLNKAFTIGPLTLHKADLKEIAVKTNEPSIHCRFLADFDCQNYQSRSSLFLLRFKRDQALISARGGSLNGCPVKIFEGDLLAKTASLQAQVDAQVLLDELEVPSFAFSNDAGVAFYDYQESPDKRNVFQEHYRWKNLESSLENTEQLRLQEIEVIDNRFTKKREARSVFSLKGEQFSCSSSDLTDDLDIHSFHCHYPGSRAQIEVLGHKTPLDLKAQISIKADHFKNHEKKTFDVSFDWLSEDFTVQSQPQGSSPQHIFAHGNLAKKELKWHSSHENLELDWLYEIAGSGQETQPSRLSHLFEHSWSLLTDLKIKNLYLFGKTFHNVELKTGQDTISLNANYLHNKGRFFLSPEELSVHFDSLFLEEIWDLKNSFSSQSSQRPMKAIKSFFPKKVTFEALETSYKRENLGLIKVHSYHQGNRLELNPIKISSKNLSHEGLLRIGDEIETLKGQFDLKSLPKPLRETLKGYGLLEAQGTVQYDLSTSKGFSELEGSTLIIAKNCKITRRQEGMSRLFDLLTGRFLENSEISPFEDQSFFIDNIYLKATRNAIGQITLSHCLLKIGPLVTVFDGTIQGESVKGTLTIIPRVTKVFPAASLLTGQIALGSASFLLDLFFGDQIAQFSMQTYPVSGTISEIILNKQEVDVVDYSPPHSLEHLGDEANIPGGHFPRAAELAQQ